MDWERYRALEAEFAALGQLDTALVHERLAANPRAFRYFAQSDEGKRERDDWHERVFGGPELKAASRAYMAMCREVNGIANAEFPEFGYGIAQALVTHGYDRRTIITAPDRALRAIKQIGPQNLLKIRATFPYRPPPLNTHHAERALPCL